MRLIADLVQLGFTEYEAKVYLALLHLNPATGYQLSKESGVPRSMVYEALKRLHGRGAALESVEGRTTRYKPVSPALLLDQVESEHIRRLKTLRQGLGQHYLSERDDRIWSLTGRSTALAYAERMIRDARDDMFMVLTDHDLEALREEILASCQRGVAVSTLLTGNGQLACGQVVHHPPLESELQGLMGTLLIVADGAELLIASSSHLGEAATITRNADLVLIARQFVWMELFTQRVYARLGPELLARLEPEDRRIFESSNGR
jgi:Cd2+/Zn2+-exporting ATPase